MSMTTVVTIRDPPPSWNCSDFAGLCRDGQGFAGNWAQLRASRVPSSDPRRGGRLAVRLPLGRVADMTEISVSPRGGDAYDVTVSDSDGSTTTHTVTAGAADVDRFGAGSDASSLIGASFRFLLDRESKEAILPTFDLSVIARYFPDYPARIGAYLSR